MMLGMLAVALLGSMVASIIAENTVFDDISGRPGWFIWGQLVVALSVPIPATLAMVFGSIAIKGFDTYRYYGYLPSRNWTGQPAHRGKATTGIVLGIATLFAFFCLALFMLVAIMMLELGGLNECKTIDC